MVCLSLPACFSDVEVSELGRQSSMLKDYLLDLLENSRNPNLKYHAVEVNKQLSQALEDWVVKNGIQPGLNDEEIKLVNEIVAETKNKK